MWYKYKDSPMANLRVKNSTPSSPVELRLTGLVIKERSGYASLCPDVDVASQGGTVKEAREKLLEAIQLYMEVALESNLPLLRPVPPEEDPRRRLRRIAARFPIKVFLEVSARAATSGS